MKQNNEKKKKSPQIKWKIFSFMLVPTFLLLAVLWITQTMLLGVFYAGIKTEELKNTTEDVIKNIEYNDIQDRILFWSSNGNINIRVVDTSAFEALYSTGEAFDSVIYGMGTFGMWEMYNDALDNNGELVRYYSEDENYADIIMPRDRDTKSGESIPDSKMPDSSESEDGRMNFRQHFEMVPRPAFFDHIGKHNDLLYAKISKLSDGSEIMVVADTRISPLDSTVATLRLQLICGTILSVLVALGLSYIVSRRISKPIEKTTKSAKILAGGNFDVKFEGKGYREIEELNETLNYTSSELGKVEGLRRELMANVSHDMRTPLTMIVGYSEVMRDIPGENNPENVQVIIDEANRLTEFVNSVLDLSKLQSGMEELEIERVDITDLLEKSVERYKKLMPEEDFQITLDCIEHVFVNCDVTKMTQVIHNLTDNAINYAGKPKRVSVRQTVGKKHVRIEISDNGDGINQDELPYIWDRYYKTDKSHKRNVVGSGIGLSIVKEILKKHSARFGVESKKGEGSTFWFELELI